MQRSTALRLITGVVAGTLTGCGSDVGCYPIAASNGSPSKPTNFGVTVYTEDNIDKAVSLVAGCGGTLIRVGASKGYDYTDALFAAASQQGLRVILISPYASQPVDISAYAELCATIHTHYAEYNPIWEIWNEPNLAYYWGAAPDVQAYTKVAIATAKALRAAGAQDVWSGGTSGIDFAWTLSMVQQKAFEVMNGCAVHTYAIPPCTLIDQYTQLIQIMPAGVQIHTTETCVPSTQDQVGFIQQVWYLHRSFGLPTMVWCELRDGTAGSSGIYDYPYGLVTSNYTPKPSYYAAKSLTATESSH
jgi:hypothetical protein